MGQSESRPIFQFINGGEIMNKSKHNRAHADLNGNSRFAIAGLLPTGKENAVSTEELVRVIGCGSARELQQYIAQERKAGAVICSSTTGGYYLPANQIEMAEFCRTLENRARNTLIALESTKKAMEGQQNTENGAEQENG